MTRSLLATVRRTAVYLPRDGVDGPSVFGYRGNGKLVDVTVTKEPDGRFWVTRVSRPRPAEPELPFGEARRDSSGRRAVAQAAPACCACYGSSILWRLLGAVLIGLVSAAALLLAAAGWPSSGSATRLARRWPPRASPVPTGSARRTANRLSGAVEARPGSRRTGRRRPARGRPGRARLHRAGRAVGPDGAHRGRPGLRLLRPADAGQPLAHRGQRRLRAGRR